MSTAIAMQLAPLLEPSMTPQRGRYWSWDDHYEALIRFVNETGNARPSTSCITGDGYRIGSWVIRQRRRYREGALPVHRKKQLEAIPGWTWHIDNPSEWEAAWEGAFSALQRFAEDHGHAQPAWKISVGDIRLGVWVSKQREHFRDGRLSPESIQRLQSLPGWVWRVTVTVPNETSWWTHFSALQEFVASDGHARPPKEFRTPDGLLLGRWVSRQRSAYKKGGLEEDRARRLEALTGWAWDGSQAPRRHSETQWERRFQDLAHYAAAHGHANPRTGEAKNADGDLARWVIRQRDRYANGTLSPEQTRRLEQLPQWVWRVRSERRSWECYYAAFTRYVADSGHTRPPVKFRTADGMRLGQWVIDQRRRFRRGLMGPDQVQLLEQLPGWQWQTTTSSAEPAPPPQGPPTNAASR